MIRAVTTDDLGALVELNLGVQRLHVEAERERFTEPSVGSVEAWFVERLRDERWQALVADIDARCAGYILFERVDRDPGTFTRASRMIYVHQLGVDASFRRRGIGRALLEAVEDEAIAWGADQVALDTWSFNAAARAFFTACGYEVYNERLRRRFSHEPERMLRPMRPSGATMAASLPQRRFGWLDMWVPEGEDPRADGGWENSEKGVLLGQLTDRRLTLEMKCAGLDAAQMATPSVPPSDLTLLGLVRHLASVEHYWVRTIIQCREQPGLFVDPAGNDAAFTVRADAAMVDHAWRAWEAEVENTDRVLARIGDLGEPAGGRPMPIREVIVHLIREYTQHLGHADLLRERIDGRVGQ